MLTNSSLGGGFGKARFSFGVDLDSAAGFVSEIKSPLKNKFWFFRISLNRELKILSLLQFLVYNNSNIIELN